MATSTESGGRRSRMRCSQGLLSSDAHPNSVRKGQGKWMPGVDGPRACEQLNQLCWELGERDSDGLRVSAPGCSTCR